MNEDETLIAEYGSASNLHFPKGTAYDSSGKEIIEPICDKCKELKNAIYGKETMAWICLNGCVDDKG